MRAAASILTLRRQLNKAFPDRPQGVADGEGIFPDARHIALGDKSGHNPDKFGVCRAWDIARFGDSGILAEALRTCGDARVSYIIWNRHIANPKIEDGLWRPYHGTDPHTGHIHLSVSDDPRLYDDVSPWNLSLLEDDDMFTDADRALLTDVRDRLARLMAPRTPDHTDKNPRENNLSDVLNEVDKQKG